MRRAGVHLSVRPSVCMSPRSIAAAPLTGCRSISAGARQQRLPAFYIAIRGTMIETNLLAHMSRCSIFTQVYVGCVQGGEPCRPGVAMIDLATGLYAVGAITSALFYRQKTNTGQHVQCNLLSTQVNVRRRVQLQQQQCPAARRE